MESFIDDEEIESLLNKQGTDDEIRAILNKSLALKGLSPIEAARLLNVTDGVLLSELFETSKKVKNEIYGKRMVLFAPLYVSNHCTNNCLYCSFRIDNKHLFRNRLSILDIQDEVKNILSQGHKRVLMLMGENDEKCTFEYFLECVQKAYGVIDKRGNSLRRINLEIAPLTSEEFNLLSKIKFGTYTVFQETYHRSTYKIMHPAGKKSDYDWRLLTMDRALGAGLKDVGIGALFGLYDFRYEVLGLLFHAMHLDQKFGVGPHTISIPRIEYADSAPASQDIPHKVNDNDFKKIVAVLRLCVPYTGIILSTREPAQLREQLYDLGVSQMSAGSKTSVGGYGIKQSKEEGQFEISDNRSTEEVIRSVIEHGYIPSFCTGCYRVGRVGGDFMELAKPGLIKNHCLPNALLTLKEYLLDYADEKTRSLGEALISKNIKGIEDEKRMAMTLSYLKRIEGGERDLFF